MSITVTAAKRRGKEFKYLKGSVIDIGCGPFPIKNLYRGITEFKGWDLEDGDAQYMINCKRYDCVHSSHSLEHMVDPYVALQNWIHIANKYLVIVLPDEEMYERMQWPSKFNWDHKHSFHMHWQKRMPESINVLDLLKAMRDIEVLKVERITHGFNPSDPSDHTERDVECAIEIILKKV